MKKQYFKRIVMITSLVLALIVTVLLLQEYVLMRSDHNRERIKAYYLEDPGSIDVVLIGSSEVYCGYSADLAYEQYGFTSYPYATQACTILNYKPMLKEVIRTQDPKLILIEINGTLYDDEHLQIEANARNIVDNMPLNANKSELIHTAATDNEAEYYMPIIKYHNMWNDFPRGIKWDYSIIKSQLRGYNLLKGYKTKTDILVPEGKVYREDEITDAAAIYPRAQQALIDLLEYCSEQNLDNVVFVRFPHLPVQRNHKRIERSNKVGQIIREYGFDFVTFDSCNEDIGLDVYHDFYNIEHLNIYGTTKFTSYLGQYLRDHYDISPSQLTVEQKKEWDESAAYFDAFLELVYDHYEKGILDEPSENYKHMKEMKQYYP